MGSNSGNITVGNISGQGIAIGHGAKASVQLSAQQQEELATLVKQLLEEIHKADIPDGAKQVLGQKAAVELVEAVSSPDPAPGLSRGLERINDQLQGLNVGASKVEQIVSSAARIASMVGIGFKAVAPYLAGLL